MRPGLILIAVFGLLAFGAAQASAYDDGPSASIDPGQLMTYPTALAGLGDTLPTFDPTDVAIAGIPDKDVGIDSAPAVALPDPPPGTTLIVDDDHMQCPNATFTSINVAVAAALPGYTIKVCPGIYTESVIVNKQLTFRGSTQPSNGRCAKPVIPDPKHDSIVRYPNTPGTGANGGSAGFSVQPQAGGTLIDGFIVEALTGPSGPTFDADGIYSFPGVSGTVIRGNILQHNSIGARLNNTGAIQTVVERNCVRDNNLGADITAFTPLFGQGIYLDMGLNNALIHHNFTTLNNVGNSAGMNLFITTDVTIRDNRSVADGSAMAIFASSAIDIRHNKATDALGSTFFFGSGNSDLHIVGNHLENGAGNGINFSLLNFGGAAGPSTMVEVGDNQVEHMGSSGIRAGAGGALTASTLARNHSHDNVVDGIRIETGGNGGNAITLNTLKHNGEHDCHDDTIGPGTGGTANTWTNNEGDTQNRPGLCKHAATT